MWTLKTLCALSLLAAVLACGVKAPPLPPLDHDPAPKPSPSKSL